MKRKSIFKRIIGMSLVGCLAIGVVSCSSNEDVKNTLDKDTLIVGIDDQFAPMGFRDENGELVGFDLDIAKAVGEKMDKEIKFQPIDWSMKESELNGNKIDFIWNGYTITDSRKEQVAFSNPYLNNKQIIVTMADSKVTKKADLKGKKVGAQNQSSAVEAMEKEADLYDSFDSGKAVTYEDNNQALMDLEAGRVDAVVVDEVLARYYIKLKGKEKYKVLEENFGEEEYGVGMRQSDTELVERVNAALKELKEDGTLSNISIKWFEEDIIK